MTADEATKLETSGRYADFLRAALEEKTRAAIEGRRLDEAFWTLQASRACRRIGKAADALQHAAQAVELARGAPAPPLPALLAHARGAALRCARRYDESLAALGQAVDLLPGEGHDLLRAEFLLETAETALEAGGDAKAALERGGALARALRDPRLVAWALCLRAQAEPDAAVARPLAAAYELATRAACPELRWQILWRLSERAEGPLREDLFWCAVAVLSSMAETLDPEDATFFWRSGPRRVFVDLAQRRHGPPFLHRLMLGGPPPADPSALVARAFGLDPGSVDGYLG